MKIYPLLLLTFLNLTSALGQEPNNHIINEEQNTVWISDFQNGSLNEKINKLKNRIVSDQKIFYTPPNPHGKIQLEEGYDTLSHTRPLYFFKTANSKPFFLPANIGQTLVEEIKSTLTPGKIESIEINYDKEVEVIYGTRGSQGIITVVLKNEEQYQKLKDLAHNPT